MFQTKVLEKMWTHQYLKKNYHLWDNAEKYGTARRATDDSIVLCRKHALCMPVN